VSGLVLRSRLCLDYASMSPFAQFFVSGWFFSVLVRVVDFWTDVMRLPSWRVKRFVACMKRKRGRVAFLVAKEVCYLSFRSSKFCCHCVSVLLVSWSMWEVVSYCFGAEFARRAYRGCYFFDAVEVIL
jgi:hypothetical protein